MNAGEIKHGFDPVYNSGSKLLILGSFPSVKSRKTEFYYGNPRNRFWETICPFFGERVPEDTEDKRNFLLRNRVALWDIVTECEIDGSKDATIKNYVVADLGKLLQNSDICYIILNGGKAYEIFFRKYSNIGVPYIKLPSTSPANARFSKEDWYAVLSRVFK